MCCIRFNHDNGNLNILEFTNEMKVFIYEERNLKKEKCVQNLKKKTNGNNRKSQLVPDPSYRPRKSLEKLRFPSQILIKYKPA